MKKNESVKQPVKSLIELKAEAYDLIVRMELAQLEFQQIQGHLAQVNDEIKRMENDL